jgi:outer membrane receptor protein involved in Fe transport
VPLLYQPDSLWNYEIGEKATLLDGRMTLNSALYYIDWKDMQLSFRNVNTGNTIYVTNAGKSRSYGLETELAFRPTPAVDLNASLALNSAEISEDAPGVPARQASARGPAVYGLTKGMRLPGAAKVTASAGFQYNWFNVGSGEMYFRIDGVYGGSSYIDFLQTGSLEIGGYTLANVKLGYKTGNYDVSLFVNNAFDDRTIVNAIPNADNLLADAAYRIRPRTIGLTIRANY